MTASLFQRLLTLFVIGMLLGQGAQAATAQAAYKLGTFERNGKSFVGVVLRDQLVIDLAAANTAIKKPASTVKSPADMLDLITRYNSGLRSRIVDIVAVVNAAPATQKLAYVHTLKDVRVRPPLQPSKMLNTAINYRAHAAESNSMRNIAVSADSVPGAAPAGTKSATAIWERAADDERWNPYMFLKSTSAIIAEGEPILLPVGRKMIDWECELGVVISQKASRVPLAQATDYIFGYTLQNDVSDREGRGDTRYGSDWLMGKSHDTFAPLGPFIVPKEFVPNPQNLPIRFTLNNEVMQEDNTSLMIHTVFEQVVYASNILTLQTGDVIATGTPGGVGGGRKPPIYFKDGDKSICTYEGIGTLTNPVKAL